VRYASGETMQLATERLLLREFEADDWRAVLGYQNDPRYLRYYDWTGRTEADVRDFVGTFIAWQRERPRQRYQLAIVLRPEGRLIGNCGIRVNGPDLREAGIGYKLNPDYWGRGYATEAASAIVGFGFDALALHRIWACCIAENTASARVLEKLGFRLDGRLHERARIKGRWHDTLTYAILEREWREQRLAPSPDASAGAARQAQATAAQ
jgi:RimJ/RimL family protein N-acetyltransferase